MARSVLVPVLATALAAAGCGAVAGILGAPKIVSVTVIAPAGLLLGDSAQATFDAQGDDGKTHNGRPVTWRSSDPSALPIDDHGKMVARIAGRTVTISAEVNGTTGTATVGVASDDSRFAYALADQPTAASPYVPDPANRYNSSGGTIEITRTAVGLYSVRFAGLGRTPGQRDNVQVSGYSATSPTFCKPDLWDASGLDLRVAVACFSPNGTPIDSRFTILATGAWAFGQTAPLAFAVVMPDSGTFVLDSAATTRNSTGGNVLEGRVAEGQYAMDLKGLEAAWVAAPAAIQVTAMGTGPRRCRLIAYDRPNAGLGLNCSKLGGGPGDAPFSMLWLQHGRPSMRFGFAYAHLPNTTTDYNTDPTFLINSSGGSVKSRKTATGQYHIVFAGLGRPPGATETVLVSPFITTDRVCDITAWGNTGVSDLFVNVSCVNPSGAATDTPVSVMVVQ